MLSGSGLGLNNTSLYTNTTNSSNLPSISSIYNTAPSSTTNVGLNNNLLSSNNRLSGSTGSTNSLFNSSNAMSFTGNTTGTAPVTGSSTFPVTLHDLLTNESREIISWDKDGLKFTINDAKRFRCNLLPKYFGSK